MENQEKTVPYSHWPWWVKVIVIPMKKPINPYSNILLVIGLLLIISLSLLFNLRFITDINTSGRGIIMLFANLSVIGLWQASAMTWIGKNSSWDVIKAGTLQKIVVGFLLIALIFGYPLFLLFLQ